MGIKWTGVLHDRRLVTALVSLNMAIEHVYGPQEPVDSSFLKEVFDNSGSVHAPDYTLDNFFNEVDAAIAILLAKPAWTPNDACERMN